jgi:hypothetical protein
LLRNAQKRDKKNRTKQPKAKNINKTEGKKAAFFVMSPDGFFSNFVFRVLELPLLRNAQKNALKKIDKK